MRILTSSTRASELLHVDPLVVVRLPHVLIIDDVLLQLVDQSLILFLELVPSLGGVAIWIGLHVSYEVVHLLALGRVHIRARKASSLRVRLHVIVLIVRRIRCWLLLHRPGHVFVIIRDAFELGLVVLMQDVLDLSECLLVLLCSRPAMHVHVQLDQEVVFLAKKLLLDFQFLLLLLPVYLLDLGEDVLAFVGVQEAKLFEVHLTLTIVINRVVHVLEVFN